MEESASRHVNVNEMCFLVRLRRRKCNFDAPGPSPVQFFRLPSIFQKIDIFIIFWTSESVYAQGLGKGILMIGYLVLKHIYMI